MTLAYSGFETYEYGSQFYTLLFKEYFALGSLSKLRSLDCYKILIIV